MKKFALLQVPNNTIVIPEIPSEVKDFKHGYFANSRPDKNIFPGHKKHYHRYMITNEVAELYEIHTVVNNPFYLLYNYYKMNFAYSGAKDHQIAHKGFDYLLNAIVNRELEFPSKRFLFWQFFSFEDGCLMVDYIHRGMDGLNYQEAYTDKMVDLVEDNYGTELLVFGYNFHGFIDTPDIIVGEIDEVKRASIAYDHFTDTVNCDVETESALSLDRLEVNEECLLTEPEGTAPAVEMGLEPFTPESLIEFEEELDKELEDIDDSSN